MSTKINILFILIFTSCISLVQAQSFDKVKTAISISSAKELATYFDNNVELSIDGKTSNYSKAQAEFVVRDFFKNNPVTKFTIIHNGNSQGGLIYVIGKYETAGKSFRTLIRMRNDRLYNLSFTEE